MAAKTSLEAALEKLEGAQELLGFASLNDSSLFALAPEEASAPRTHTPYGVKAAQGTRPNMEDSYSVQVAGTSQAVLPVLSQQEGTCTGDLAPLAPVPDPSNGKDFLESQPSLSQHLQEAIQVPLLPEDLAILSVFDGHGGIEVAEHCRERLHKHFACSLSKQRLSCLASRRVDLHTAASDSPSTLDSLAQHAQELANLPYHVSQVGEALRSAFHATDQELAGTEAGDFVGATAVVAVVGKTHIWVAHCGDSRAVIQRNGEAEALTRDHKPEREDEAARIKAAGGRIVFNSGSHRVMGMLAMSRAIGDHFLRPYVIAEPEVACIERTPKDEVLVLATDGLWDVFSCKEVTTLAMRCIVRSKERGMSRHGACRVAASVLTKVALERGSRDNITVIVVDVTISAEQLTASLNPGAQHAGPPAAHASSQHPHREGGLPHGTSSPGSSLKHPHLQTQQRSADHTTSASAAATAGTGSGAPPRPPSNTNLAGGDAGGEAGAKQPSVPLPRTVSGSGARPPSLYQAGTASSMRELSTGGSGDAGPSLTASGSSKGMGNRTQSFSVGTCLWLKGQPSSGGAPGSQAMGDGTGILDGKGGGTAAAAVGKGGVLSRQVSEPSSMSKLINSAPQILATAPTAATAAPVSSPAGAAEEENPAVRSSAPAGSTGQPRSSPTEILGRISEMSLHSKSGDGSDTQGPGSRDVSSQSLPRQQTPPSGPISVDPSDSEQQAGSQKGQHDTPKGMSGIAAVGTGSFNAPISLLQQAVGGAGAAALAAAAEQHSKAEATAFVSQGPGSSSSQGSPLAVAAGNPLVVRSLGAQLHQQQHMPGNGTATAAVLRPVQLGGPTVAAVVDLASSGTVSGASSENGDADQAADVVPSSSGSSAQLTGLGPIIPAGLDGVIGSLSGSPTVRRASRSARGSIRSPAAGDDDVALQGDRAGPGSPGVRRRSSVPCHAIDPASPAAKLASLGLAPDKALPHGQQRQLGGLIDSDDDLGLQRFGMMTV